MRVYQNRPTVVRVYSNRPRAVRVYLSRPTAVRVYLNRPTVARVYINRPTLFGSSSTLQAFSSLPSTQSGFLSQKLLLAIHSPK